MHIALLLAFGFFISVLETDSTISMICANRRGGWSCRTVRAGQPEPPVLSRTCPPPSAPAWPPPACSRRYASCDRARQAGRAMEPPPREARRAGRPEADAPFAGGGEIHRFDTKCRAVLDVEWDEVVEGSGFSFGRVAKAVDDLAQQGIDFTLQPQRGRRVMSYYFYPDQSMNLNERLSTIRETASANGLGLNLSPCNPRSGDPEGAYDVDFYSTSAGKSNVVAYLVDRFGSGGAISFGFGDNTNDLEMLAKVGRGYLVSNATPSTESSGFSRIRFPYAQGIHFVLDEFVRSAPQDKRVWTD